MVIFRIIRTLLMVGAVVSVPAVTATGDENLSIDVRRTDQSGRATAEELRELHRQLLDAFRLSSRGRLLPCTISVSGAIPPGELKFSVQPNGSWLIEFDDSDGEWQQNYDLRRRLFSLLLAAAARPDGTPPGNPDFLPYWIVAAIDHRLETRRTSMRMLRSNLDLPLTRILAAEGRFPDFRSQMLLDPRRLPPAANRWYRELSRVMLEAAVAAGGSENTLLNYAMLHDDNLQHTEAEIFASTLGRRWKGMAERLNLTVTGNEKLSEEQKIQSFLEVFAERLAFTPLFPRPPRLEAERLQAIYTFRAAEPGGIEQTFQLPQLPKLLAGHPAGELIRSSRSSAISQLAGGADAEYAAALRRLARAVDLLPLLRDADDQEEREQELQAAYLNVVAVNRRLTAIEDFLLRVEAEQLSPLQRNADAIREAMEPDGVLSSGLEALLDRTERFYLDE